MSEIVHYEIQECDSIELHNYGHRDVRGHLLKVETRTFRDELNHELEDLQRYSIRKFCTEQFIFVGIYISYETSVFFSFFLDFFSQVNLSTCDCCCQFHSHTSLVHRDSIFRHFRFSLNFNCSINRSFSLQFYRILRSLSAVVLLNTNSLADF